MAVVTTIAHIERFEISLGADGDFPAEMRVTWQARLLSNGSIIEMDTVDTLASGAVALDQTFWDAAYMNAQLAATAIIGATNSMPAANPVVL